MPLSRHSVRTYSETSSHATCQGTIGHSHLSSLSHCGLILAQKSGVSVRELISTYMHAHTRTHTKTVLAGNELLNPCK